MLPSTTRCHHHGQPNLPAAAATIARLFWPGRFLLAASPRPGESCTGCGVASSALA